MKAINDDPEAHGNPEQVLLWQPHILPHPNKSDAYMPNLTARLCFPLPPASAEALIIGAGDAMQTSPRFCVSTASQCTPSLGLPLGSKVPIPRSMAGGAD